jgi:hypothetical protein
MKLLGIISDHMFCIHQILEKKWQYNEAASIDFKKAYDSVRREVVYNILIQFGVPIKLVMFIKMWLNETYSKVHIGKHLPDVSYPKWSKTSRCFIATSFQLCLRICH